MITLVRSGTYKLIETKANIKILQIDRQTYAWVEPRGIGQILVSSHTPHKADHALAMGTYNLYDVEDEPHLTDLQHLELEYGDNAWQGYLLLTGLPDDEKRRSRIVPTLEVITGNPRFSSEMGFHRWGSSARTDMKKFVSK